MKMRNSLSIKLLLTMALIITSSTVQVSAQGKGGGKDKGGDSPGSPVLFQARTFTMPHPNIDYVWIYDCNNQNQVVGGMVGDLGETDQHAFLFDAKGTSNVATDLNTIVSGIPAGKVIRRATAINAGGDIAVYVTDPNNPDLNFQPGMIDMSVVPPALHLISEADMQAEIDNYIGEYAVTEGMNDVGDMLIRYRKTDLTWGLFVYNFGIDHPERATALPSPLDFGFDQQWNTRRINNPTELHDAQIVGNLDDGTFYGQPFIYELNSEQPMTLIEPYLDEATGNYLDLQYALDINDKGEVLGEGTVSGFKGGKPSGKIRQVGFIWNDGYQSYENAASPNDINESADFLTANGLHHRTEGFLNPFQLLDPDDLESVWVANAIEPGSEGLVTMTDRAESNFPVLFGRVDLNNDGVVIQHGIVFLPVTSGGQ